MPDTRKCPYCAEEIPAEAVRCRYCRGRVAAFDFARWHRGHPERRIAGVAAAIAHAVALPVGAVRLAFIVFTLFTHVGPLVYGALWLVIPPAPGTPSALERGLVWALAHLRTWQSTPPGPPRRPNGGDHEADGYGVGTLPGGPLA